MVHGSNQTNHKCYFCAKTFTGFPYLTIHMRRHTKEVPFKCDFCEKKFTNQLSLKRHNAMYACTLTNGKPFQCSECNKEFKTNGDLRNHMVSHSRGQLYSCEFCGYATYFKQSFNVHVLQWHNNTS